MDVGLRSIWPSKPSEYGVFDAPYRRSALVISRALSFAILSNTLARAQAILGSLQVQDSPKEERKA
jgi:hypothetical protein